MSAPFAVRDWLGLLRPGDWLLLSLLTLLTGWSFPLLWQGGGLADRAVVRQDGRVFATLDLHQPRQIAVPGPLGQTLVMVDRGRARVLSDPGPRQYCVRQGWLSRPGEIAICAPNRVSLHITGRLRAYDSMTY